MLFSVIEFNERKKAYRLVNLFCHVLTAFDEADKLNASTPNYLYYYVSNEGDSLEKLIDAKLINSCKVVAEYLYLFDLFVKKRGREEKAHHLFNLVLYHCKVGASYLDV